MKLAGNKLIRISLLGLLVGTSGVWEGCTSKFDEINTSKTAITTLGPTELPYLFSRAQQQASYAAGTYQTAQNLFADLYAQYFATTTPNFQSDRYFMHRTWINSHWNPIYTQVVPQLKTLFEQTDPNSSQYALANIWWVFSFHRLTDYYGPVPYFDAGVPANSVKYDAQDKIYDDFFKRLAAATTVLKGKTSEKPYGTYDIIYSGDVTKWIKFANTLRLRLAMRISKVDPTRAKTEAEAAIAGGLLTDVGDNAVMVKTLADNNGLATISGWGEFRMSAAMESVLKGFEDPRIGVYFQPAYNTKTYEGIRNGLGSVELTDPLNTNDNNSNIGDRWIKNTGAGSAWDRQLGFRQDIMHTAEAYFLMAEAALNGWNVGSNGTAQQLYEKGIKASMEGWGITGSAVDTYVASTKTPIAPQDQQKSPALSTITVKWGTTEAVQREQIGTQKWLALYPDGMEAWAEARRTLFPKRYPVVNSVNTDLPITAYPRRIPFLLLEEQSNTEAVKAAVSLLGGPDNAATRLWWDKN
ncbi:SusD/RagB family nutrient-binding outer membrane lipoprotein [Spirosoma validum]|uniref:SusD/RagB family nutrient-binding outer membrane lipoprotein n=1 Tax=Spirosoma validum TaxID=2771355 RepID=A0A927GFV8_9BACT|nr:SusD/RagB family nutrient-binding outer membrane lipoprotein [Spirosoma validum]MBD2756352.1 SusD/RagB family nutrient-binding outer membrane lipoprotein [Spirosoma validum]